MLSSSRYIISASFALMLLLLLLIIMSGLGNMASNNEHLNKIVGVHNVRINQIANMRSIARERSLLMYHSLLARDPFIVDEEIQQLSRLAGQFIQIREQLTPSGMSDAEKKQLGQMLDAVRAANLIQDQLIDLLQAGRFDDGVQLLQEKLLPAQITTFGHYDAMLDTQRQLAEEAAGEARVAYRRSMIFMLALSAIVIVLGLAVSAYTIRKTRQAEQALFETNEKLEQRVNDRTRALADANDSLQGTIGTLRDTQNQLIQAEKMASLGNLVAGISHEINTPLGIGLTSASSLQEEIDSIRKRFEDGSMKRSDLEHFFDHARQTSTILLSNMDRASNLIRSFKQVAVDQSSDDWRQIDMHAYFEEVLTSLRPKLKHARVTVKNGADNDLQIYTLPGAIYQIISNLILNALIHAYDEDQQGTITLGATRKGEHIEMTCRDDGNGIAEQHLGRIFEPFYTTRRGAGGTGLGLNIVYNLVTAQLNGQISVASQTGSGTTFTVRVPIQQAGASA